jgi:ABC-type Na+ transport system ATPase subunit NatA
VLLIDHGKVIHEGSPAEIKAQAKSETLEDAFLKLTQDQEPA